jgi:UDP-N-acetylmuramoylalanine--D-glutamate ligase
MGCLLKLGTHDVSDFMNANQIIVSPGVPLDIQPLRLARGKGIEIIGELEWAWRQVSLPVVAVTGTNGKTTTTALIGEILKSAGKRPFVGGNIGTPLSQWLLGEKDADILVLEVSSFQLDTASGFCPDVGVLLNVTEDHLDRYAGFDAYAESKISMFHRQRGDQVAVFNLDDPICAGKCRELPGRLLGFSRKDMAVAHAVAKNGSLVVNPPEGPSFVVSLQQTRLKGAHNEENIMAAALAASALGVSPAEIQRVVDTTSGLHHRVEWVRNWKGIDFFDDSKGTNVGAVLKALEGFNSPVLLLLGGRDKLGSYASLAESLQGRGKGAFVFGEAAHRIREALEGAVPVWSSPGLAEAFQQAVQQAEAGDVVLLSPACSSFDQYESYAHRGDHFKRLVGQLKG